jgi:hypothetical protein
VIRQCLTHLEYSHRQANNPTLGPTPRAKAYIRWHIEKRWLLGPHQVADLAFGATGLSRIATLEALRARGLLDLQLPVRIRKKVPQLLVSMARQTNNQKRRRLAA